MTESKRDSARLFRLASAPVVVATALLAAAGGVQATHVTGSNGAGGLLPPSWSDFNGDSRADLAVGAPGDTIDGRAGAGSVTVLYGGANGLGTAGSQLLSQNSPDIVDASEPGDAFGTALAAGDFNRDGYADLAVGVPGEDRIVNNVTKTDAGAVHVIYGSTDGLGGVGDQLVGSGENGWKAGSAVATLDCHREAQSPTDQPDGHPELAIGSPGASTLEKAGVGHVDIYRYMPAFTNFDRLRQNNGLQEGAHFGASLASGAFAGDAQDDLAIGVPDHDLPGAANAGEVRVWVDPCTVGGFGPSAINMSTGQVPGEPAGGDGFGFSLAAGPADIPGKDYLFIGVPFDDLRGPIGEGPRVNAGSVYRCSVKEGIPDSCLAWFEGFSGWPDEIESGDQFGWSIAVGEFGRGTGGDVAVGVPGEAVAGHEGAGAVDVLYRDGTNQRWTENSNGIPNAADDGENMGRALRSINWGDGAPMDLAIGVTDQVINGLVDAGAVHVLYGSSNGLTAANDDYWHRALPGVVGEAGANDRFGAALR